MKADQTPPTTAEAATRDATAPRIIQAAPGDTVDQRLDRRGRPGRQPEEIAPLYGDLHENRDHSEAVFSA